MPNAPRPIRVDDDVAYVTLTKGYEAIIDASLAPVVGRYCWYAREERRADGSLRAVYAVRDKDILLHQVVLASALAGTALLPDHRNGDTLDNREANLRPATPAQNAQNRPAQSNNASGVKGVYVDRRSGRWVARIKSHGVRRSLGTFKCITAAALAYAKASREMHGEFGRTA